MQHHGGELKQTHYDGALAVVVELFLARAKVGPGRVGRFETGPGSLQVMQCQFCQEETQGWQEAGLLTRIW